MKLTVVALDYDGTTSHHGTIHPKVREAIVLLRYSGIAVVMVTGRRIDHLREEVSDLSLFNAVVAENGAVVLYPESGRFSVLGKCPPESFTTALAERGVDAVTGQCITEAHARDAVPVLRTIREQQLPLVILFNRERMMVLSQAVSKATGLREALRAIGLSPHNAVAIGDAENDHELLGAVEMGIAVGWGSAALKAVADEVLEGSSPSAVAKYLTALSKQRRVPPGRTRRRRLLLGSDDRGGRFEMTADGRNILIAGEPKSGKSWIAGLLCEQLVLMGYAICVIDPEGDYAGLEEFPAVLRFGGDRPLPLVHELIHAITDPTVSTVLNLSRITQEEKLAYVPELLRTINIARRESGLPHRIVIDEAHYFLNRPEAADLIDTELAGYILVTYQISQVEQAILQASEAILVTHESDPREIETLQTLRAVEDGGRDWGETLPRLELPEAALLPGARESGSRLRRFTIAPRLTRHVRHRTKYIDVPVELHHAFRFVGRDVPKDLHARSLHEFSGVLDALPVSAIDGHLRNHDFSSWISGVFGDGALAARILEVETGYALDPHPGVNEKITTLVRERYGP